MRCSHRKKKSNNNNNNNYAKTKNKQNFVCSIALDYEYIKSHDFLFKQQK